MGVELFLILLILFDEVILYSYSSLLDDENYCKYFSNKILSGNHLIIEQQNNFSIINLICIENLPIRPKCVI